VLILRLVKSGQACPPQRCLHRPSQRPVSDLAGEAHLMGHDHHGHALTGVHFHNLQHLTNQLRIQCRVGSSNNMTLGDIASARLMATRCFCPPERLPGIASALLPDRPFSRESARCRAVVLSSRAA
jgi:hypothetical protein